MWGVQAQVPGGVHCFHLVSQPCSAAYLSWSPMLSLLSAARSLSDMLLACAICSEGPGVQVSTLGCQRRASPERPARSAESVHLHPLHDTVLLAACSPRPRLLSASSAGALHRKGVNTRLQVPPGRACAQALRTRAIAALEVEIRVRERGRTLRYGSVRISNMARNLFGEALLGTVQLRLGLCRTGSHQKSPISLKS